MRRFFSTTVFILAAVLLLPQVAPAEGLVSEIRAGILAHDVPIAGFNRESGADLNLELLFSAPQLAFFEAIGSPRPHIGTDLNLDGNTSQVYAGLTWEWDLPGDFFLDLGGGGALHNGYAYTAKNDRKSLGSSLLFHLTGSIGYRLTERTNVSLMYDHISNAGLANNNEGLDNLGVRFGYLF